MSSSKSRKLRQNRRYHRTQVTITCGSNFRFQNKGGRHDFMASRYQIRSCNTSGQGTDINYDATEGDINDSVRPVWSIKRVLQKEIDGKEYDICAECSNPLAEKLKGKGRTKRQRETVGEPPKIWGDGSRRMESYQNLIPTGDMEANRLE
jgi:hypothetical protein